MVAYFVFLLPHADPDSSSVYCDVSDLDGEIQSRRDHASSLSLILPAIAKLWCASSRRASPSKAYEDWSRMSVCSSEKLAMETSLNDGLSVLNDLSIETLNTRGKRFLRTTVGTSRMTIFTFPLDKPS